MKFKARLVSETEAARLLAPSQAEHKKAIWVPKSICTYYKKHGLRPQETLPLVHIEVESWWVRKNSRMVELFTQI